MANASRMSFVTIATRGRRPIFQISRFAELFIDTLLRFRAQGRYKLHAYLVMPDHVHLLLTPQSGLLDQAVALIQNGFTQRLGIEYFLWEPGFTAHPVQGIRSLEILRAYLHQTPVRAHIVPSAELYPYSSAHRFAGIPSAPTTTSTPELASYETAVQGE